MSQPLPNACLAEAEAALEADDVARAWRALEPLESLLGEDRDVSRMWLQLLRASSGRASLVAQAHRVANGFPADAELVTLACDALIREAERLAPDVPPPPDGAAALAVACAQRCLEGLPEAKRADPEVLGYLQINLANALRLCHLHDRAGAAYRAALKRAPERGHWWFNYGLLHKARGAFDEGLEANEQALARLSDEPAAHKPTLWNIAICATALGQGRRAADAYRELGIGCEVNVAGMPQVANLPPVQVRVATVGPGHAGPAPVPDRAVAFELLWVLPLSPCHGVVQTPTYRQGSVDYGDVVLWDAVPVGTGEHQGRVVPRFPLLSVLRKGDEHRFRFVALQRTPGAIDALEGPLPQGGQLFVHRPPGETPGELVYGKLVLPADVDLKAFKAAFEGRVKALGDVELVVPELLEALGMTPEAGKAHTLWRGLERTVEKRNADKAR